MATGRLGFPQTSSRRNVTSSAPTLMNGWTSPEANSSTPTGRAEEGPRRPVRTMMARPHPKKIIWAIRGSLVVVHPNRSSGHRYDHKWCGLNLLSLLRSCRPFLEPVFGSAGTFPSPSFQGSTTVCSPLDNLDLSRTLTESRCSASSILAREQMERSRPGCRGTHESAVILQRFWNAPPFGDRIRTFLHPNLIIG
jgi:hypothetical protein